MGNSEKPSANSWSKPKRKPLKKHGPQHQHLLSIQHEERLRRFLLQEQLGRWMDDAKQKPGSPEPIQGVQEHLQRGRDKDERRRRQDGTEDRRLGVQARGAEGVRAIRATPG